MGQYDITVKHLFRHGGRTLLAHLGIEGRLKPLDTELPSVKERRLDFLAEVNSNQLLHIEFQSSSDAAFAFRMLGYYGEILERLAADRRSSREAPPFETEVRQILIYIGSGRWPKQSLIRHTNLSFIFEVVNAIDVSAASLVQHGDIGDAVFGILCRNGSSRDMVRAILDRIAQAPSEQQKDAFAQLLILSGLRKARHLVEKEYERMGLVINVEDSKILREPIDRAHREGYEAGEAHGESKGMAFVLATLLKRRFKGGMPGGLVEHLSDLQPAVLAEMVDRLPGAKSVEEVLGSHMPSRTHGYGN
ncbi:MAG: hypothetical protein E5V95_33315 [Mesorhizobium sp.]|uniref:hypothetical protein n=1 Tax=Mesorhizobium sp. TaxID=1871066 RepID=UPI0011FB3E99|nr:hypothetical protein [Mesorhizobium sp.]TIV13668.1 MAG: hypothetical protein E5V95_33315 [Mesorhizobium sp.]